MNNPRYICIEENINLCWVCEQDLTLARCSILFFKDAIQSPLHKDDIKQYVVDVLQRKRGFAEKPIYLRKALELYYPEYVEFYDKMLVLI